MKQLFLYLIFLVGFQISTNAQPEYALSKSVNNVLFLGNSITWSGEYVDYIETYLRVVKPEQPLEFINVGLPSETVSGLSEPNHADGKFPRPDLHERLSRVLTAIEPDLVIACYGMNDGIYLSFDETRFSKFKEGIVWLHNEVAKQGIPIIHATPPVFDERKGATYANVLDIYSDWLIGRRYTSNWNIIDIHWPMRKYLEDKRTTDSTFVLAEDGIHPGSTGHWLTAKEILLYLGEQEVASADSIEEALSSFQNVDKLLLLVSERQEILRNAWLTYIGHQRPGLPKGLPIDEAKEKVVAIDREIAELLN
ncbi:MAG: SGNH/GDSL hydrolase family protein [Bacteroidota bacterium]